MAHIRRYTTKSGPRFRVEWRKPGETEKSSIVFTEESDARMWQELIEQTDGDSDKAGEKWSRAKIGSKKQTVSQIVSEFIEYHSGGNHQTLVDYRSMAARHIEPVFGDTPAENVTARDSRRFLKILKDEKRLSAKTIQNIFAVLRSAYNTAVDDGIVDLNPISGTKLPTVRKRVRPMITRPEIDRLIETIDPDFSDVIQTFGGTGIRWSELEALLCEDLICRGDQTFLNIDKAMTGQGRTRVVGPPKTDSGYREIILDTELGQALRSRVGGRKPTEHLFTMKRGGRMHFAHFADWYLKPALKECEINENVRSHAFRHNHASMLISAGMDPKLVAYRLGHSDPGLTLNIYTHRRGSADTKTLEIINKIAHWDEQDIFDEARLENPDAKKLLGGLETDAA